MKIKAKMKGDIVKVKAMAKHEMTTYDQAANKKDANGVVIGNREDANFITRITASVNGKLVYEISTSQFLSKNPIFKFKFKGAKVGDTLEVTWIDRKGNTKTGKAKIK
jgi:sulfur-oxidizing protein SoxZ